MVAAVAGHTILAATNADVTILRNGNRSRIRSPAGRSTFIHLLRQFLDGSNRNGRGGESRIIVRAYSKYGHPIHALETFVDRERFKGTCYQAANWVRLGSTQGRTRNDRERCIRASVKDVYLYPLVHGFRRELCAC